MEALTPVIQRMMDTGDDSRCDGADKNPKVVWAQFGTIASEKHRDPMGQTPRNMKSYSPSLA